MLHTIVHMVTNELLDFIRTQFASGMSPDEMERLLVSEGGWDKHDVDEAMVTLGVHPKTPSDIPSAENDVPSLPVPELKSNTAIALETSLSRDVPHIMDGTVHSEDFLGIFSALSEKSLAEEMYAPMPPREEPALAETLSPFSLTQALAPSAEKFEGLKEEQSTSNDTPGVVLELSAPESAILPEEQKHPDDLILPREPVGVKEVEHSILNPKPQGIQFDLSAIQKGAASSELPIDASSAIPPKEDVSLNTPTSGSSVETKSMAEVWLQGLSEQKRKDAISPTLSATLEAPTPGSRSSVGASRTMGSDLLLRGMGPAIPGIPSLGSSSDPIKPPPLEQTPESMMKQPAVLEMKKNDDVSLAEKLMRRNKVKKALLIASGILVSIFFIGGAIFAFLGSRGPDPETLLRDALSNFFTLSSFSYQGNASVALALSAKTSSGTQNGLMKFDLAYQGALRNGPDGYGDGAHRIKLAGQLQSGDFAWSTDVDSDVRVLGSALYFHILSLPESVDTDPNLFKTYWVKVDLAEVAKELALQGVSAQQEGYGNFGGSGGETSFNALLRKYLPFQMAGYIADEPPGTTIRHYRLKTDPDRMITLTGVMMRKYLNKDLILTDEKKIRLRDALAKIQGDVWIDTKTQTLTRFTLSGNFDDDILDMHVKGPVSLSFDLADLNKSVSVDAPTPMLTLEELRARMDDYKKIKEKRVRDEVKLNRLSAIVDALAAYKEEKGRYPATLATLAQSGKLATSSVDTIVLKQYLYAAYLRQDTRTKAGRCTTRTKLCSFYHLGVNLDDVTNPALESDADFTDDILGVDTAGCSGESDVACYDVISPQVSSASSQSAATSTLAAPSGK